MRHPEDEAVLNAAYDLLTKRGNEEGWEEYVDRAHHDLGLLLGRLALGKDLQGREEGRPC